MFKTKSPIPYIIIAVILIAVIAFVAINGDVTAGGGEWSAHWEFTF